MARRTLREKNATKYADSNDWFTKKTENKKTYRKISEMIALLSCYYQERAEKYNLPVYNMDSNFNKQLKRIESFLIE